MSTSSSSSPSPSSSSSSPSSSLAFQPTCPNGGTFYACTTGTKFIGCCNTTTQTTNPCTTGCIAANLKPASFFADAYGSFPDQECSSGSLWYTCKNTKPPFWGCCKVNACAGGCTGVGNLSAAYLSSNPSVAAAFLVSTTEMTSSLLSLLSLSSSSSTTAATRSLIAGNTFSSSATASPSLAIATTATTTARTNTTKKTTNIGAIVGGTVAGVAAVVVILLVLFFFLYRPRKAAAKNATAAANAATAAATAPAATSMSISHQQHSPLNTHHIVGNNRNTHPALRHHPETSAVVAEVQPGLEQSSCPNIGESKSGAYEPQIYQTPPSAFPPYTLLSTNSPTTTTTTTRPPPPSPPSYIISEIDGTPLLTKSSSSPPPASNTFPSTRAYSASSAGLPSPEAATKAGMEGNSQTPSPPPPPPLAAGKREEEMKEKRKGAGSPLLKRMRAGDGEGEKFGN